MSQDQQTDTGAPGAPPPGGADSPWGQGDFGVWLPGEQPPPDAPPPVPQWSTPPRPRMRRAAELAAPGRRIIARIIDWVLAGVVFSLPIVVVAVAVVLSDGPGTTQGPSVAVVFVLSLVALAGPALYEIVCIAVWGRTVGKWLLSIKVVDERDGTVPGWYSATARWVPNLVSIVPFVGGLLSFGLWMWALVNLFTQPKRQTPFDLFAGTVVIRTR